MLGPELALLNVDVELLGEALYRQRGELAGVRVDVGQVMAEVGQFAPAAEPQAPTFTGSSGQGRGEAGLW